MTDQQASRIASDHAVQDNKSKTKTAETIRTPEDASVGNKQVSCCAPVLSPTKPGSPRKASSVNASPRLWGYRPKPVRTLSTPLARSQSARAPSADRRVRLRSDGTPVSTTYRDDYKSPEEISYKLHSLNLETSLRALSDTSTTYRDSYQWPPWKRFDAFPRNTRKFKEKKDGNSTEKRTDVSSPKHKTASSVSNQQTESGNCKAAEGSSSPQHETINRSSLNTRARRPQLISTDPFWNMKTDASCHKLTVSKTAPSTPSSGDRVFQSVP